MDAQTDNVHDSGSARKRSSALPGSPWEHPPRDIPSSAAVRLMLKSIFSWVAVLPIAIVVGGKLIANIPASGCSIRMSRDSVFRLPGFSLPLIALGGIVRRDNDSLPQEHAGELNRLTRGQGPAIRERKGANSPTTHGGGQ